MTKTKRFIRTFLGRRNISEPNGQRLHEYRCTKQEYRDLYRILRECRDPKHLRRPTTGYGAAAADNEDWMYVDEDNVMACFVLYASEWCRRWEGPQRRTWDRLLVHIRWTTKNYPELYPAMVDGLQWWKRPVIKMPGSTRYLDTIAHEGGIRIEGFTVVEYRLVSQDERQAHYEPCYHPAEFKSGPIQVRKRSAETAPHRLIGLFDTSSS